MLYQAGFLNKNKIKHKNMQNIKQNILKFWSLFSVVRGYNILVICIAQYLASIFILSQRSATEILFDINLFMLVLSGALAIAGGYIINAFYDEEKDLINTPSKVMIERLIGQNTKLTLYFLLNFSSVFVASYVSFRAVLFFSGYIFLLWFYSHRLKKILFIGNIASAILAIIPFFAVFIYYQNFDKIIFIHAIYLFSLILAKDLTKDLQTLKGDFALGYRTIAVSLGEKVSKKIITSTIFLTLICIYFLTAFPKTGNMKYYFIMAGILLIAIFLPILQKSKTKTHFSFLRNLLKIIIICGVFSIALIN